MVQIGEAEYERLKACEAERDRLRAELDRLRAALAGAGRPASATTVGYDPRMDDDYPEPSP